MRDHAVKAPAIRVKAVPTRISHPRREGALSGYSGGQGRQLYSGVVADFRQPYTQQSLPTPHVETPALSTAAPKYLPNRCIARGLPGGVQTMLIACLIVAQPIESVATFPKIQSKDLIIKPVLGSFLPGPRRAASQMP